jgi:hypothetical protein
VSMSVGRVQRSDTVLAVVAVLCSSTWRGSHEMDTFFWQIMK